MAALFIRRDSCNRSRPSITRLSPRSKSAKKRLSAPQQTRWRKCEPRWSTRSTAGVGPPPRAGPRGDRARGKTGAHRGGRKTKGGEEPGFGGLSPAGKRQKPLPPLFEGAAG